MLAVRLPQEIEERLAVLAERTGRTRSFYVREALLAHLDDLEDAYLAEQRAGRPARRWKLEELEKGVDGKAKRR